MPDLYLSVRSMLSRCARFLEGWSTNGGAHPIGELLENRQLLSVAIDSAGWTQVTPAADTRIIYVSSSTGNDKNNGLSVNTPVASIARGESLLQNNSADWMLLKCGDTWNTGLGNWKLSGRSSDEPMLIGSYGAGARPLLDTGTATGLWAAAVSTPQVSNLDVIGLHFDANGRDPNTPGYSTKDATGIEILTKSDSLLIENCQIENYTVNINLQSYYGPITNAAVRRNIIDDSYAVDSHSQGLYAYGVSNLLIEGNTFDANGYNAQVPGAVATYYNHDCYISSNNTGVVADDNIFARAAGYGLQMRPGGIVENNLFIDDPIGMSFGLVNGSDTTTGGVTGIVNGNVFVGGGTLDGSPYGQGIVLGNTKPGYPTLVSNNIFADGLAHAPAAITLTYGIGQIDPQNSVGLNDLVIEDNVIYNWYRGVYVDGGFQPGGTGLQALNDVTVSDNAFQDVGGMVIQSVGPVPTSQLHFTGNTYSPEAPSISVASKAMAFKQWTQTDEPDATEATVPYSDATRSLAAYDSSIGGLASDVDFLAGARAQSEQSWQPQFTPDAFIAYMQAGFDTTASPHNWAPPTPPIVTNVSFPNSVMARTSTLTFTITYLDDQAVNVASLSSGNLTVTAPGYSAAAQFVSSAGSGAQVTATYSIAAPHGTFRAGAPLHFSVHLNENQVTDNQGFPAMAGTIGSFKLRVQPVPPPPRVTQVRLINHAQGVAVTFNQNMSASITNADVMLQSTTGETIDSSALDLSWTRNQKTAIIAFTGEPAGILPAGTWHLTITGGTVAANLHTLKIRVRGISSHG